MALPPATRTSREPPSGERLTIGQVAQLSGITAKAIRYYESVGLLPPPQRQENGYRSYHPVDANRLILLRCLRLLGVSLETLKPLLHEEASARCADLKQELLRVFEERSRAIDQELEDLSRLREALACNHQQLLAYQPLRQASFGGSRLMCLPWQSEVPDEQGAFEATNDPR